MKPIWIVAHNTFLEIIRDRILYGMIICAVALVFFSLALGQLTFTEQTRITLDFGFTAIHICAAILSIFVGSTLVAREIEKKTILTLLARPVSRTQFVVGKYFGLLSVILASIFLISLVLVGLIFLMRMSPTWSFVVGLYGVFAEAAILLAATIFFGSFASPMLSVAFALGAFLIGHWLESLRFFAEKSGEPAFIFFARVVRTTVPNLEYFNWRSLFIYGDPVPAQELFYYSMYGVAWCTFLITVATLILWRRDLG